MHRASQLEQVRKRGFPPLLNELVYKRGQAPLPDLFKLGVALLLAAVVAVGQIQTQTPKPLPAILEWRPLIGEYTSNTETVIVLEKDGKLYALVKGGQMTEIQENAFYRDKFGKAAHLKFNGTIYERKPLGPEKGATQLKVKPVRPVKV